MQRTAGATWLPFPFRFLSHSYFQLNSANVRSERGTERNKQKRGKTMTAAGREKDDGGKELPLYASQTAQIG